MYKFGKKRHPSVASWVAEQTRAWAGGTVVMDRFEICLIYEFFSFSHFRKISNFLAGLVAGTRSAKFPVLVPGLTCRHSLL